MVCQYYLEYKSNLEVIVKSAVILFVFCRNELGDDINYFVHEVSSIENLIMLIISNLIIKTLTPQM